MFRDFLWSTKTGWPRRRRVSAKAEWTGGEANPRFVVTSLKPDAWSARPLYVARETALNVFAGGASGEEPASPGRARLGRSSAFMRDRKKTILLSS